jgi:glycosyltransferase involved in cell wall biosynthesis
MLNWRDPWHPKAGGAELVTLRVLEHLVKDYAYQVEWFSAQYEGAAEDETKSGIRYVRRGTQTTVHLQAFARYRKSKAFDVVIDQVNTIPFLAHRYMRCPCVLFIHQLAREVWFYEAPPLLGNAGYVSEGLLLRPYRNIPAITVSQSSAESLRDIGLRGPIHIIPEAVDETGEVSAPQKSPSADVIVLGRLAPSKRPEHSIRAAAQMKSMGWRGLLHIAGAGAPRYTENLKRLAQHLGLKNVIFHGRVSNDERRALLASASLLWMTSAREGWGLVVTEAAQHWTPAVVYDSPGLRDSVVDGVTGCVVRADPADLARSSWSLLNDRGRWYSYAAAAKNAAAQLNWDRTAREFESAIQSFTKIARA